MSNHAKNDPLGSRMKKFENVTRFVLPPRTFSILRVDGKAFHTWTRGLQKPYDPYFMHCMDTTAARLCEQISGTQFAYVQSDEISVLAVDFLDINTQPWFDGVVQKWASVGAAIASAAFNAAAVHKLAEKPPVQFDARVFTIPDFVEVANYFKWRQQDSIRNSVTMLAQHYYSHKELQGKNVSDRHELIHKAGDNWALHPSNFKNGRVVRKRACVDPVIHDKISNWYVDDQTPVFTQEKAYLEGLIPIPWNVPWSSI
jgi:tRNA(His) guanylyltransferase